MLIKKQYLDVCGGDCEVCDQLRCKTNKERMVVKKRKVSTKYVPPDVQMLKHFMDVSGDKDIKDMTDEELDEFQSKLIEELKNCISN